MRSTFEGGEVRPRPCPMICSTPRREHVMGQRRRARPTHTQIHHESTGICDRGVPIAAARLIQVGQTYFDSPEGASTFASPCLEMPTV